MTAVELAPRRPDLEQYAYSWLAGHHTLRTRVEYARDLSDWLRFCHGHDVDPLTVDRSALDAWVTRQLADGAAASSVNRRLSAVRGWYEHLVQDLGVVPKNPAARVQPPKVFRPVRVPRITVDQAKAMGKHAAADGPDLELAYRLMFCNGLRLEEVCEGLRTAAVEEAPNGELYATVIGKGSKPRLCVFSGRTAELLHGAVWPPMQRHSERVDRPAVTANKRTIQRRVAAWGNMAGISGRVHPHALRHAAATVALHHPDVKESDVQDMLGHADPRTTRAYDRDAHAVERNPSRVLEQAIEETA